MATDTVTMFPPGTPDDEVTGWKCNESEWVAANTPYGSTVWARKRDGQWWRGTYRDSFFYDGIVAYVYEDDPDDLVEHALFLALGDELRDSAP